MNSEPAGELSPDGDALESVLTTQYDLFSVAYWLGRWAELRTPNSELRDTRVLHYFRLTGCLMPMVESRQSRIEEPLPDYSARRQLT